MLKTLIFTTRRVSEGLNFAVIWASLGRPLHTLLVVRIKHFRDLDLFLAQPPRLKRIFQGKKMWGKNRQVLSGSLGTDKRVPKIEIDDRNHRNDWGQAPS